MVKSCDYCKYLSNEDNNFCKLINGATPANKQQICAMYRVDTRKVIDKLGPEEECKDGSCQIKKEK